MVGEMQFPLQHDSQIDLKTPGLPVYLRWRSERDSMDTPHDPKNRYFNNLRVGRYEFDVIQPSPEVACSPTSRTVGDLKNTDSLATEAASNSRRFNSVSLGQRGAIPATGSRGKQHRFNLAGENHWSNCVIAITVSGIRRKCRCSRASEVATVQTQRKNRLMDESLDGMVRKKSCGTFRLNVAGPFQTRMVGWQLLQNRC